MNTFTVTGYNRKAGAIGISYRFVETVEAETLQEAQEKAREIRYAKGYEHVHIVREE